MTRLPRASSGASGGVLKCWRETITRFRGGGQKLSSDSRVYGGGSQLAVLGEDSTPPVDFTDPVLALTGRLPDQNLPQLRVLVPASAQSSAPV